MYYPSFAEGMKETREYQFVALHQRIVLLKRDGIEQIRRFLFQRNDSMISTQPKAAHLKRPPDHITKMVAPKANSQKLRRF